MRIFKYICLLFLPALWSCEDKFFDAEMLGQKGEIKYLFMASIDVATVESRVTFEPEDHGHNTDQALNHSHDLALHWEEGDEVELSDENGNKYIFVAELMDVDNNADTPDQIVFAYRGDEVISNESCFSGTAVFNPEKYSGEAWQSVNGNADHLKNFGPILEATLDKVNLIAPVDKWLEEGEFTPIRFAASGDSDYAYFKIEVSGFNYPIWGGGNIKLYLLRENIVDNNDHHTPIATLSYGTAPTNMVTISGGPSPKTGSAKYIWPNLKEQDLNFCLGVKETLSYTTVDGYPYINDKGEKEISDSLYISVSFPNTKTEKPFIEVPEYYVISPSSATDAQDYEYTKNSNLSQFESLSQYYKFDDIMGYFYIPVPKMFIQGSSGDMYIATVLQCGWSGDLYVWEKKVPEDINIEAGKFYVLDYNKHKPEFAVKFAEDTYFRSTFLEQNYNGTDAPRFTILGERAVLNGVADNPNRIVGNGLMSSEDVKKMISNHGAFLHSATQMCAIYPGIKKVKWKMKNDTAFDKSGGYISAMCVYKLPDSNHPQEYIYEIPLLTNGDIDGMYNVENNTYVQNYFGDKVGIWDKIIYRPDVKAPENYVGVVQDYMSKITKGIMNPNSVNFTGKDKFNSLEFILQNRFDPVMNSTKTCNLWRAPYGADINALCNFSESVFFVSEDKKHFIFESTKTGHRICLPNIGCYINSVTSRSPYTNGSGNYGKGVWKEASTSTTDIHFIAGRSVRTFGSNNPAYMQALDISYEKEMIGSKVGKISKFAVATKFDLAYPVLPVFRWELSPESNEGVLEWTNP